MEERPGREVNLGGAFVEGLRVFGRGFRTIGKYLTALASYLMKENQGHWGSVLVQVGVGVLVGYVYGVLS